MSDPTGADLAARIDRLPAAERAIVVALVERLDKLTAPAPRARRRPAVSLEAIPPEERERIRADLARHGFVPTR